MVKNKFINTTDNWPPGVRLENKISREHGVLEFGLGDVGGANKIKYADDKIVVLGYAGPRKNLRFLFVALFLGFILFVIPFWVDANGLWWVMIPPLVIVLFLLVSVFKKGPECPLIFNREKGEVGVVRDHSGKQPTYKPVSFSDMFFCKKSAHQPGIIQLCGYARENGNTYLICAFQSSWATGGERYLDELFNTIIWYMDRNRPLPSGSALDPFRERDYERRKEEGFPEPLFPSEIETPEWVGASAHKEKEEYRRYIGFLKNKYPKLKECRLENGRLVVVRS